MTTPEAVSEGGADRGRASSPYRPPSVYLLRQVFQPRELVILAVLLLEIAVFWKISPGFTTANEFLSAARYVSLTGIAAVGASMVIISGGIDLSPGALYGLAGVVMATLLCVNHVSPFLAILGALGTGALVGLVNGAGVAYLGIPPFIVTLGTYSITNGLAQWMTNGQNLPSEGHPFTSAGQHSLDLIDAAFGAHAGYPGISLGLVVMVLLSLLGAFFLAASPTGRYIHAVGGNEQAARHAGVHVRRVKLTVYSLAGVLASVSGIFYVARYGGINSGVGPGAELDIIAAAVVGGVSLQGGKGSPIGAIIGAYIITLLRDGLVFNNVPDAGAKIAVGAFIILAVVIDKALKSLSSLRVGRIFPGRNAARVPSG